MADREGNPEQTAGPAGDDESLRWVTLNKAASMLGINRHMVQKRALAGEFRTHYVAELDTVLVNREDVEAAVATARSA